MTEYSPDTAYSRTNTVSDEGGAFRITGLEPGRYILTARSPGYADGGPDDPIEIDTNSVDGMEIVLEPGASIVGVVTGLTPSDLTQVDIQAWRNDRSRNATPDAEGNFTVDGIAPGTWRVIATKGDRSDRRVERSVTIERGAAETFIELPFETGLRLSGHVFDSGEPLGGGRLSAYGRGNDHSQSTTIDREGRFEVEDLQPGTYQLTISRPAFGGMEYRSIELQSDLDGLRIDLEPTAATLTGIVVDAQTGQPIDFAHIVAADTATIGALARDGDTAGPASATAAFTITDGQFELKLRADAEHLWVTGQGYEGVQLPVNVTPGQRQEGLVIQLQPTASESPNR